MLPQMLKNAKRRNLLPGTSLQKREETGEAFFSLNYTTDAVMRPKRNQGGRCSYFSNSITRVQNNCINLQKCKTSTALSHRTDIMIQELGS